MTFRPPRGSLGVTLALAGGLAAVPIAAGAEVRLGVQGGVVFATHAASSDDSEESFDTGTRTGLSAGLVLDVDVRDRVWLRLAPGWIEKGSTLEFELFGTTHASRFELGYVELPVTLNIALGSGSVRPYLTGGGTASYLARARMVAIRDDTEESQDAAEFFKDWDFGVTAGGGLELVGDRSRGFVEARYTWGLADLWTEDTGGSFKNRTWQVLLGVTFGL